MTPQQKTETRCESCRMFDHNACEYGGIDGFCCCEDDDIQSLDQAVRNERRRCVKIVEDAYHRLDALNAEGAEPMWAVLVAIREGR